MDKRSLFLTKSSIQELLLIILFGVKEESLYKAVFLVVIDLDFVKQVAIDEVKSMDYLLPEENIDFYFTNIGNSSFNFILRFWIKFQKDDDFLKAQDEAIIKIKKRFEKENISIPYNVISLDFGVKGGINLFDKNITINP